MPLQNIVIFKSQNCSMLQKAICLNRPKIKYMSDHEVHLHLIYRLACSRPLNFIIN